MNLFFSMTDATAAALGTSAVLVAACVAAAWAVVAPVRRTEASGANVWGDRAAPSPALSIECRACGVRYRCTGEYRAKAVKCPRCGATVDLGQKET